MKKSYLLIIATLFIMMACQKDDFGLSDCLNEKIAEFKNGDYACADVDDGANVKEYEFQGETVYVFDPGTCGADMFSAVIDEDCNTLGNLGGIAGITEINGVSFSEAVFIEIVWER